MKIVIICSFSGLLFFPPFSSILEKKSIPLFFSKPYTTPAFFFQYLETYLKPAAAAAAREKPRGKIFKRRGSPLQSNVKIRRTNAMAEKSKVTIIKLKNT